MVLDNRLYEVCKNFPREAITKDEYDRLLELSKDHEAVHKYIAENYLLWEENFTKTFSGSGNNFRFYEGGKLYPVKNILRKHLGTTKMNKAALIWKGADHSQMVYTYQSLYTEVVKLASALRKLGVKKGDRVLLHLPNIPELIIAMLACVKLGAVHIVYHISYSTDSLADRIKDCEPKIIFTSDGALTGNEQKLKNKLDSALEITGYEPRHCIVVERVSKRVHMKPIRDIWFHDLISHEHFSDAKRMDFEILDAEDPMFMLYTSTNLKEPKALVFPVAGFLLWAYYTYLLLFDAKDTDTFWCTADIAWITGHSYVVYGPLMAGDTVLIFEDTIDMDNAERFYDVCDKFSVNKIYTRPSILKTLMNAAQKKKKFRKLDTLELIATGGERMDDDLREWSAKNLASYRAVMFDIYSITEAGGALSSALPGFICAKTGTVAQPIPGVPIKLVNSTTGNTVEEPNTQGALMMDKPFPPLCRTIYGDKNTYKKIYWKTHNDVTYFKTGDGAELDEEGNLTLKGRLDDVLHVDGKRLSLIEIEEAIKTHENVNDCAVVSIPDEKRGDALIVFSVLKKEVDESYHDTTVRELRERIIEEIGEVALPSEIRFTRTLPKSPDGVILRDLLKDIAMQM
ncbi:acyl-CoA synthetase [Limisalsivibrio acetivorans]|uniref:acyl-CoA synthetase n=1 Tax=Limisalsivibrio acetivorans TaxID=1304888 RepID=UPI0003B423B6|nr:AMP-binding protein [Limisalsivibrio acetivorans]